MSLLISIMNHLVERVRSRKSLYKKQDSVDVSMTTQQKEFYLEPMGGQGFHLRGLLGQGLQVDLLRDPPFPACALDDTRRSGLDLLRPGGPLHRLWGPPILGAKLRLLRGEEEGVLPRRSPPLLGQPSGPARLSLGLVRLGV